MTREEIRRRLTMPRHEYVREFGPIMDAGVVHSEDSMRDVDRQQAVHDAQDGTFNDIMQHVRRANYGKA